MIPQARYPRATQAKSQSLKGDEEVISRVRCMISLLLHAVTPWRIAHKNRCFCLVLEIPDYFCAFRAVTAISL